MSRCAFMRTQSKVLSNVLEVHELLGFLLQVQEALHVCIFEPGCCCCVRLGAGVLAPLCAPGNFRVRWSLQCWCRCRVPLPDVWPCALWSLGAGAAVMCCPRNAGVTCRGPSNRPGSSRPAKLQKQSFAVLDPIALVHPRSMIVIVAEKWFSVKVRIRPHIHCAHVWLVRK